jgi:O-succinylbenzoate synthase
VGIADSISALLAEVAGYVDEGYRRIKLKIEPGWDVEPVRAVRERFGDVVLQVDANAAYTLGHARQLAELDDFDLAMLEQPLPTADLRDHAALARRLRTPICLDESITSARAAVDAITLGACAIVNIKAGRVGGYLEARRIHDVCAAHGIPVWCGGMLETGLGQAANLALAALPGFTLPADIAPSARYFTADVTPMITMADGLIGVPEGPGLGLDPEPELMERVTTDVMTLTEF